MLEVIKENTWTELQSLRHLIMFGNSINTLVPGGFKYLTKLKDIDLSYNNLIDIPDGTWNGFHDLESLKLEQLDMGWNSLAMVRSDMWIGLESLIKLHLEHNEITSIQKHGFANLLKLKELYLYNNRLRTLNPLIFNSHDFPHTEGHPPELVLSISNNPLQCDKRLCWLKKAENI